MKFKTAINRLVKRKLVTVLCITVSLAAFATLGDGSKKNHNEKTQKRLLTTAIPYNFKSFSLKSGYNYRGNNVFAPVSNKYILLNTVVTYQKGNSTYILPLKKKILLDKVKFNPAQ